MKILKSCRSASFMGSKGGERFQSWVINGVLFQTMKIGTLFFFCTSIFYINTDWGVRFGDFKDTFGMKILFGMEIGAFSFWDRFMGGT